TNGVVRLRRNDERECLKIRGHVEAAGTVAAEQDFTQVYGAAFGRNRPQNIRQILIAERRRLLQVTEFRFDCNGPAFTVDLGDTIRRGHQFGAGEIQLRRTAAVLIIYRLYTAAD